MGLSFSIWSVSYPFRKSNPSVLIKQSLFSLPWQLRTNGLNYPPPPWVGKNVGILYSSSLFKTIADLSTGGVFSYNFKFTRNYVDLFTHIYSPVQVFQLAITYKAQKSTSLNYSIKFSLFTLLFRYTNYNTPYLIFWKLILTAQEKNFVLSIHRVYSQRVGKARTTSSDCLVIILSLFKTIEDWSTDGFSTLCRSIYVYLFFCVSFSTGHHI